MLTFNAATTALNCSENVWVVPEVLAINVTVWLELTAETMAVNPALAEPAGTDIVEGTVTALLSLVRITLRSFVVAALSVTVQESVDVPVNALDVQVSESKDAVVVGVPVPLRPIDRDGVAEELLIVN